MNDTEDERVAIITPIRKRPFWSFAPEPYTVKGRDHVIVPAVDVFSIFSNLGCSPNCNEFDTEEQQINPLIKAIDKYFNDENIQLLLGEAGRRHAATFRAIKYSLRQAQREGATHWICIVPAALN